MFCPKCGSENEDSHKFCDKCGTSLQTINANKQPLTQSNQQAQLKKNTPVKLIIAIAAIAICIVVAVVLLSNDKYVELVQKGHLEDYPDVTVGELLDGVFTDTEWSSQEITKDYGTVTIIGNQNSNKYQIDFYVNLADSTFQLDRILENDKPCSSWKELLQMEEWYIAYANAHENVTYQCDKIIDFLTFDLADLYEIFDYDYEVLGSYYGSTTIKFSQDNCPYIFCMDPYNYTSQAIWDDSAVLGIAISDDNVLINEELRSGMTYSDIEKNATRGLTGVLEWDDMDEAWTTTVYYDSYTVWFEFADQSSPAYLALITAK